MLAIVATSYKLDSHYPLDFLRRHMNQNVFLVTDNMIASVKNHKIIPAPKMDFFSITTCANVGINAAIAKGATVIVKTDIDCILDENFLLWTQENVSSMRGYYFRYWGVKDASKESIEKSEIMPRICGTCAMTANDWTLCGGYNENMFGYGYDDFDIAVRAREQGIKIEQVLSPKVYHVDHGEKHNRDTINPLNRDFNKNIRKK